MKLRDGSEALSETPTPYAVYCDQQEENAWCCGWDPKEKRRQPVFMTEACYAAQMSSPDSTWSCPSCGGSGIWIDEIYEEYLDKLEAEIK